MHLSDGVLNMPVVAATSVVAGGLIIYAIKDMKQEEIPKISLMTATFFVLSLISIPIGPSSVHPLLCGLLGIILGRRAPIAIFISLVLQALLFGHGGFTTLGANTLLVAIPALICYVLFKQINKRNFMKPYITGGITGFVGVFLAVILLAGILMATSRFYTDGMFSVVRLLLVGHIPLLLIETILTAFIIKIIVQVRPALIQGNM